MKICIMKQCLMYKMFDWISNNVKVFIFNTWYNNIPGIF